MKKIFIYIFISLSVISCDKKQARNGHSEDQPAEELHLTDLQVQLGHIITDSVREQELGDELILTGIISVNQNQAASVSSRVMGRIEKLYHKNVGDEIKIGEPLYEIYSEELNLAAKEFLLAAEKRKSLNNPGFDLDKLYQSAKNKLLLYGLTDVQILEIEQQGVSETIFPILSTVTGIISSVNVKEGAYVMEGESIIHLADLSSLWVESQVYPDDLTMIKENAIAKIYLPGNEDKFYEGKVSFVNPELNPSSRINLIRIEIANKNQEMKPGTQASIIILLNRKKVLAVPTDAVILEEKGAVVWTWTGHNQFKSVMVHTGIEADGYTEILHGLNKGDEVVISGAYLLNSEFIIRNGASTMEGHSH